MKILNLKMVKLLVQLEKNNIDRYIVNNKDGKILENTLILYYFR